MDPPDGGFAEIKTIEDRLTNLKKQITVALRDQKTTLKQLQTLDTQMQSSLSSAEKRARLRSFKEFQKRKSHIPILEASIRQLKKDVRTLKTLLKHVQPDWKPRLEHFLHNAHKTRDAILKAVAETHEEERQNPLNCRERRDRCLQECEARYEHYHLSDCKWECREAYKRCIEAKRAQNKAAQQYQMGVNVLRQMHDAATATIRNMKA